MIVKEMEKIQGELASAKEELAKVLVGSEEAKAQIVALSEGKAAIEKELADVKAQGEKAIADAKIELDKVNAEKAALVEEIAKVKAQLALVPVVSNGTEPVIEGGESKPKVSMVEQLNKLQGAEKMAFYRANKKEIDAEIASLK